MALTMTRTRTQTTLTKLADMVANVHGELEFLEGLAGTHGAPEAGPALEARRLKLVSDREALYVTLRQFDTQIEPQTIGISDVWHRRYGNEGLGHAALVRRYLVFATRQ